MAIANIRRYNPDAKIIAMFRNPVDMVHSLHSQLLYWSYETESDFETAWRLQERRSRGLDIPRSCPEPLLLQYTQIGQFGIQTQRMLESFPRSQVKLILYDDFAASPQRTYDEVIEFLGIPHDHRTDFPRINESKSTRLTWLSNFMRHPPPGVRKAFRAMKRAMGADRLTAARNSLIELNTVSSAASLSHPNSEPSWREHFGRRWPFVSTLGARLESLDLGLGKHPHVGRRDVHPLALA